MKQVVVPPGGAIRVQRYALFPSVLEDGQINVFIVLKYTEFIILFHRRLLIYQNDSTLYKICTDIVFWYINISPVHIRYFV